MKDEIKPDLLVRARFFTTEEGGRKSGISAELFRCPFGYQGEYFDCGLILNGLCIKLGVTVTFPLLFLCPELIKPRLKLGDKFILRELGTIADGEILKIYQ